jgi:hypothetical protein
MIIDRLFSMGCSAAMARRVIASRSRSSASIRGRSPAMMSTMARSNSSRWLAGMPASAWTVFENGGRWCAGGNSGVAGGGTGTRSSSHRPCLRRAFAFALRASAVSVSRRIGVFRRACDWQRSSVYSVSLASLPLSAFAPAPGRPRQERVLQVGNTAVLRINRCLRFRRCETRSEAAPRR